MHRNLADIDTSEFDDADQVDYKGIDAPRKTKASIAMFRRIIAACWLVPVVSSIAYIGYAFFGPEVFPPQAMENAPAAAPALAALPLEGTFTTAGRIHFEDPVLTFRYPNFWEYGELHSDQVDATVRVIRPGNNPVRAGITLLVTRSPTALQAPKPMLPPGAKLIKEKRFPSGTTEMIFAEFATTALQGDYQHGMTLESTDSTRYVGLTVGCHGPPGGSAVVDRQFEELRATFDAVLSSLSFEPKKSAE